MGIVFVYSALQLGFTALLRRFDPFNQVVAVGYFRTARIVFGTQLSEYFLHRVTVFMPVEILFMQNQPEFDTWIGASNSDTGRFAIRHRLFELRMVIAVEHRPDLVVFLVGIFSAPSVPSKSERIGSFDCLFRNGVGNTHTTIDLPLNQGA